MFPERMEAKLLNKIQFILDVGSSSIRMLAVQSCLGAQRIIAQESILYDGFLDGQFLTPDEIGNDLGLLIEKMSQKFRMKIKSIYVGVPSDFSLCICKRISRAFGTVHKITEKDLIDLYETNAPSSSEDYSLISYSPMQYVLDNGYKTLSPVGNKSTSIVLDASYIMAKNNFIELMKNNFKKLGVSKVEFISSALGQAMYCRKLADTNKPIAIVDVGHISTSICIYKGEGLALLTSVSTGGGYISSDIMKILGLSFKDAELIKRKVILTVESQRNEYYEACFKGNLIKAPINITNQIIRVRIETIAKIIKDVMSINEMFSEIDLYLTGDGISNFKGVKNIIKDSTNLNVIDFKIPYNDSKDKYQTSKMGLAMLAEIMV